MGENRFPQLLRNPKLDGWLRIGGRRRLVRRLEQHSRGRIRFRCRCGSSFPVFDCDPNSERFGRWQRPKFQVRHLRPCRRLERFEPLKAVGGVTPVLNADLRGQKPMRRLIGFCSPTLAEQIGVCQRVSQRFKIRSCQTLWVPRQSRGFTNVIMMQAFWESVSHGFPGPSTDRCLRAKPEDF